MDGLEKPTPPVEDTSEGYLYRQYLAAKPRFKSNEEAIATLTAEVEALAKKMGSTVKEIFHHYENSSDITDDHREIANLLRQLSCFKRK